MRNRDLSGRSLPSYAKDWLEQKSIIAWRGGVDPRTFRGYYSQFYPFLHTLGKGPDEAIVWAKDAKNQDQVLDMIKAHVMGMKRRYATKQLANAAIRSFFLHNRVVIPPDKTLRLRSDIEPVQRQLGYQHLHELIGLAIQPWRSMLLVKWQSLSDNQGLIDISRKHAETLTKALRENAEICKLTMPGRKRKRNVQGFYTFIGKEALESLREYFDRERGWPKQGEPVWLYTGTKSHGKPVTVRGFEEAWLRLLKHAKLIPAKRGNDPGTRYGFNVHNTRDLAISLLAVVPGLKDHSVEYWAGHEIDPLLYKDLSLHPQFVEDQYRLAMPHLNILSSNKSEVLEITENQVIDYLEKSPRFREIILELVNRAPDKEESQGRKG